MDKEETGQWAGEIQMSNGLLFLLYNFELFIKNILYNLKI